MIPPSGGYFPRSWYPIALINVLFFCLFRVGARATFARGPSLRRGAWGKPWVASLEYGGIGRIFQAFCDAEVLAEVVPRLYRMVQTI